MFQACDFATRRGQAGTQATPDDGDGLAKHWRATVTRLDPLYGTCSRCALEFSIIAVA